MNQVLRTFVQDTRKEAEGWIYSRSISYNDIGSWFDSSDIFANIPYDTLRNNFLQLHSFCGVSTVIRKIMMLNISTTFIFVTVTHASQHNHTVQEALAMACQTLRH